MKPSYRISRMHRKEVDTAIEWAAREGWNPGRYDAACFYAADPNGFFAGTLGNTLIAIGSAVNYDAHFSFCGFYIVAPEYRHQGYGLALTKARLAYVGTRNAGIDGVPEMLDKYARLGYRVAHKNARYKALSTDTNPTTHPALTPLQQHHYPNLFEYDRHHFPASRNAFLTQWVEQPQSVALGWIENGALLGYGVIRSCQEGFKIGPLFANTPLIADALFTALAHYAQGQEVYLDIPENNPEAIALVQRYGMEKVFETARMYLKGEPALRAKNIYGITTFELG